MESKIDLFKKLHTDGTPLLLGNVWDVSSAKVYEKLKFAAIGTSSAAVADALGYEDGENLPFADYLRVVSRITENVDIPLSVDMEAGYGNSPEEVVNNIAQLDQLGVVGINLEDSKVIEGVRHHLDVETFTHHLKMISAELSKRSIAVFVNVRIDSFLLLNFDQLTDAKLRIEAYAPFADGIFLPGIIKMEEIKEVTSTTALPINVMCMPALPDFKALAEVGVKRISMGNFLHAHLFKKLATISEEIITTQNFSSLF